MKVVSPYRPFAPESGSHLRLGPYNWLGALQMLRRSVSAACPGVKTYQLTDPDSPEVSGPAILIPTEERRLMLWLLEVSLAYLSSPAFDDDTVMISPDALVTADLKDYFLADLGLMVRAGKRYREKPLLNGVQFWRLAGRDRLCGFYADALAVARQSHPDLIKWGADTEPLVRLLYPLTLGPFERGGLKVYGFDAGLAFRTVSYGDARAIGAAHKAGLLAPVLDFKGQRKLKMAAYYAGLGLPC